MNKPLSLLDGVDLWPLVRAPWLGRSRPWGHPTAGPQQVGCSWTRTQAVPTKGCPQPHPEAGVGAAAVGGRAGGGGLLRPLPVGGHFS